MNATKTLAITRPEGMRLACRHFDFVDATGRDLRTYDKSIITRKISSLFGTYDGSWTMNSALATLCFCEYGAQLCVEHTLSADLEASSICGDLDSIAWPALALHVVFEDNSLPSFIAQKRNVKVDGGKIEGGVCLSLRFKDGSNIGMIIGNSEWRSFCEGAEILSSYSAGRRGLWDEAEPNRREMDVVRYMAALLAKVLAYASIPRFAPTKLLTRAEKKAAGIHPNQQVSAPTLLLRHLPRVIKDADVTPATGSIGDAHRFMGRAGHLRHYQAERYKAMKGQWQWIPPIPPPEGIKVVYKVRKVAV